MCACKYECTCVQVTVCEYSKGRVWFRHSAFVLEIKILVRLTKCFIKVYD